MSSGIPIDPECVTTYNDLKLGKKYKFITFGIVNQTIVVIKTSTSNAYEDLLKELPEDACRWAVYDANFELTGGGNRQKICFIAWSPEAAGKSRMIYSTSKATLRKAIEDGIAHDLQATELDEVDQAALESKLKGKLI